MIISFSGHSVDGMPKAVQHALLAYDDWKKKHPAMIVLYLSTSISAEPFEENFNYWYVLTVLVTELAPIGAQRQ